MKKIILSVIMFAGTTTLLAQVPVASNPVCAHCGKARWEKQNGQWVQVSEHAPGCIAAGGEKSEEESWSPDFSSIEYLYGYGVKCDYCGSTNGHDSECLIGKTQGYIRRYWEKSRTPESYKFRIQTYEQNIRLFAEQARARQKEQTETLSPSSTKLKDYEPMPEQESSEPLIPQMDHMARPDLPNSIHVTAVQETSGPNDPTIYDKRIEFKGDEWGGQAIARGHTNQNGQEEWTLFKKDGTKLAGPFSNIFVTDKYKYDYFVACDTTGLWGIYDKYGKCEVNHQYTAIEPLKFCLPDNIVFIRFNCQKNGKWGMIEEFYGDRTLIPFEYDYITESIFDPELVMAEKDGKRGLAHFDGRFEIPAEYAYIEQVNIKKVGKYYIVSKDNATYGAYNNGFVKFPLEFTLGEIRQKINEDAAAYIKQREEWDKLRNKQRKRGR